MARLRLSRCSHAELADWAERFGMEGVRAYPTKAALYAALISYLESIDYTVQL